MPCAITPRPYTCQPKAIVVFSAVMTFSTFNCERAARAMIRPNNTMAAMFSAKLSGVKKIGLADRRDQRGCTARGFSDGVPLTRVRKSRREGQRGRASLISAGDERCVERSDRQP
jgi:hypothetical protein